MSPAATATTTVGPAPTTTTVTVDRNALVQMLQEKEQHIQELEAECRGLAEQLMALQAEILTWVDLDR
jgi:peptidoglycan hydrolase CwlO-like protein